MIYIRSLLNRINLLLRLLTVIVSQHDLICTRVGLQVKDDESSVGRYRIIVQYFGTTVIHIRIILSHNPGIKINITLL
jgi:hypothetical protein